MLPRVQTTLTSGYSGCIALKGCTTDPPLVPYPALLDQCVPAQLSVDGSIYGVKRLPSLQLHLLPAKPSLQPMWHPKSYPFQPIKPKSQCFPHQGDPF